MSSQDLIRDTEEHKSYSGGILAILVICLLLGLIALVTYLTMPDSGPKDNLMPIYFTDIFKISSLLTKFEYEWKDGHLIFRNSSGDYYSIRASSNISTASIILPRKYYTNGMSVSFDRTVWLIPVNQRKRQDLQDEYSYKLYYPSLNGPYYHPIIFGQEQISYLTAIAWGPRSKYMVAVYRNNVYYSLNPLISSSFICISCQMDQTKVYGQFLGYYNERIFKGNKAFLWNNNGQFLTFFSLTDDEDKKTNVEIFYPSSLYPNYHNISYAKAGSSPSIYNVAIHVFHLASQGLYSLNLTNNVPFQPYYIVHIQWYNGSFILLAILSADQLRVALILCESRKLDCFTILDKISSDSIDMNEYQNMVLDHDDGYVYVAITVSGNTRGHRHIGRIKVDRRQKNMITWLNLGSHDIIQLNSLDPISRSIYYTARSANDSIQNLYRVYIDTMTYSCESCNFTTCYRNKVDFMGLYNAFIHRCLGPEPESYRLFRVTNNGYISVNLETNQELKDCIKNKSTSKIEYSTIDIFQDHRKYRVVAKIFQPRHLNPNHVIQYPVILILEDSPVQDKANDNFAVGWVDYLTSYLHYVVIKLDVRGTRDNAPFLRMPRMWGVNNGHVNIVMDAIKDIVSRRPYIDNSSIGVIGASYGGYLAGKLINANNKFPDFRCGVALSPIVDFSSYDAFFSERHIGDYKQYKTRYQNSKLQASTAMKRKELLLVHYENINNILFENSAKLIKDLVEKDILFDLLLLYQSSHSNDVWDQNKYALKKITKFFVNCFNRSSVQYSILENDNIHSL